MAKYKAKLKESATMERTLIETNNLKDAIDRCLSEVRSSHSSELAQAKTALELRGYYCMGYSSR